MDPRDRILREIARNAALTASCDLEDVSVTVSSSEEQGFVAVASIRGREQTFRAYGKGEQEATWSLLMMVVDAANGSPLTQSLIMTPELRKAIRLLQLSRLDLIEEIRRELEANPIAERDALDTKEE
jgi:hypothetical protein